MDGYPCQDHDLMEERTMALLNKQQCKRAIDVMHECLSASDEHGRSGELIANPI